MNQTTFHYDDLLEAVIGQTVIQLLTQQKPITLPSLLQALRDLPDTEELEQAEAFLKSAFTIRAA